jgi:hypothetical protein
MSHKVCCEAWTYEELDDEAKAVARNNWREGHLDYEWWDFVYDDAKQCAELIGINIKDIWFNMHCQGAGACWEGSYNYVKGSVKAIKQHAPKDEDLHRIAETLQEIQKSYFYSIFAQSVHRGWYNHEGTMEISADVDTDMCNHCLDRKDYEALRDALREYARWIHQRLEEEYDWLMADAQIEESIITNEVNFHKNGKVIRL